MKGETGSVLQVRQPKADRDCIMHAPLVRNQKFWWKKELGAVPYTTKPVARKKKS